MILEGSGGHFVELSAEDSAFKGGIHTARARFVKPGGEGLEVRVGQLCHGVFNFYNGAHDA